MPAWLRNLVMLVVLSAWLAVVAASLIQGNLPDAALLGVPAAIVLALAPPVLTRRRTRTRTKRENAEEAED